MSQFIDPKVPIRTFTAPDVRAPVAPGAPAAAALASDGQSGATVRISGIAVRAPLGWKRAATERLWTVNAWATMPKKNPTSTSLQYGLQRMFRVTTIAGGVTRTRDWPCGTPVRVLASEVQVSGVLEVRTDWTFGGGGTPGELSPVCFADFVCAIVEGDEPDLPPMWSTENRTRSGMQKFVLLRDPYLYQDPIDNGFRLQQLNLMNPTGATIYAWICDKGPQDPTTTIGQPRFAPIAVPAHSPISVDETMARGLVFHDGIWVGESASDTVAPDPTVSGATAATLYHSAAFWPIAPTFKTSQATNTL